MADTSRTRLPSIPEAIISLLPLIVGIGISIAIYGLDPQIPMNRKTV